MTNKMLSRLAPSFAIALLVGAAGVAHATPKTPSRTISNARVAKRSSTARRSAKIAPARTKQLPREWVWQRKAIRFDGVIASRR